MLHVPGAVQPGLNTVSTPDNGSGLFYFPQADNFDQYFWNHKSDLRATCPASHCCLLGWKASNVFLLQELLKAGDIGEAGGEGKNPHMPANVQFFSTVPLNTFGFQLVFTWRYVRAHVFST